MTVGLRNILFEVNGDFTGARIVDAALSPEDAGDGSTRADNRKNLRGASVSQTAPPAGFQVFKSSEDSI